MGNEPDTPFARLDQLRRRRAAIQDRLEELQRLRKDVRERIQGGQDTAITYGAALSQAAAQRAAVARVSAYLKAAETHDRAADLHEKAAASANGDTRYHLERAAFHRAAAAKDREHAAQDEGIRSARDA